MSNTIDGMTQSIVHDPKCSPDPESMFNATYCKLNGNNISYHLIRNATMRPIPPHEYSKIINSMANIKENNEGNPEALKLILSDEIHSKRMIQSMEHKSVPFGKNSVEILPTKSGYFLVSMNLSYEEYLDTLLLQHSKTTISNEVEDFFHRNYKVVFEIIDAALYWKFVRDKKSNIWFHVNSNYGKTFFFHVEKLNLVVDEEVKTADFKGCDPAEFCNYLFLMVDEAKKFSSNMKLDTISYDRKYAGHCKAQLPMKILCSANEIGDLSEAADEQVINRVTKISVNQETLEALTLQGLKVKPNVLKPQYDALIIRYVHNKLKGLKSESDEDPLKLKAICSQKLAEFYKRHERGLNVKTIKEFVRNALADVVSQKLSMRSNGNNEISYGLPYYLWFPDANQNSEGAEKPRMENEVYILDPNEFLEKFISKFGDRKYAIKKAMQTISSFCMMIDGDYVKKTIPTKGRLRVIIIQYRHNDNGEVEIA